MSNDEIAKQYDDFSVTYSDNLRDQDKIGNGKFYEIISTLDFKNKKLLDIGCGDGSDLLNYQEMGAMPVGLEPSLEFIKQAKSKSAHLEIIQGVGENLPFEDNSFDIVVSKYALQNMIDVPKVFEETARVLKKNGYLVILSKHPIRQFLEKVKTYDGKEINYFEQKIVDSYIYEKKIHLREPTHTFAEYFSAKVLKNFDLLEFIEDFDFPASEQIDNFIYPTFFVAKYLRR